MFLTEKVDFRCSPVERLKLEKMARRAKVKPSGVLRGLLNGLSEAEVLRLVGQSVKANSDTVRQDKVVAVA